MATVWTYVISYHDEIDDVHHMEHLNVRFPDKDFEADGGEEDLTSLVETYIQRELEMEGEYEQVSFSVELMGSAKDQTNCHLDLC